MVNQKLQPVRGTKDLYGSQINLFNHVIRAAKYFASSYGFKELSTPIFEFSEIFERNLGESSDIVSKEVYKFEDRGDNFLTLRPEFTAGVIRSFISNGDLSQILPQKFFSYGPIFRYDRPQKGRQRQFHQVNFELIGVNHFLSDVEIISLANRFLNKLASKNKIELQINSLGCVKTRSKYQDALVQYFQKYEKDLSNDSKIRLQQNPLRILDSKDKKDIEISEKAPKIGDFYELEARENFDNILNNLEKIGIDYQINQRLVRGLDYYTSTVFEFVTDELGAQNTILAGGRYDNLISKMGGADLGAIGFAAGVERLMLLEKSEIGDKRPVYFIYVSENEQEYIFKIADELRNHGIYCEILYGANFKKQMKKATQNNAKYVVIIGEDEIKNNNFKVKDFDDGSEVDLIYEDFVDYFKVNLSQ